MISVKQYSTLAERINEIGRLLGGWQAQFENLRIASIVAEAIGDKERKPELEAALARCVKAVEQLQTLLLLPKN